MAEHYSVTYVESPGAGAPVALPVCGTCGSVVTQMSVAQHDEWHMKLRSEPSV